jgi:hypothetical protein
MARAALLLGLIAALAACGGRAQQAGGPVQAEDSGPIQPEDDPERGIYNYDHARELGIPVDPIPPADQLCPTNDRDDGFSAEELDTPEEVAELDRQMATAPSCVVDPRLALIGLGYSVQAVRDAPNAFEKGRLVCANYTASVPAGFTAAQFDRFTRNLLRNAYGVDGDEPFDELAAGCRTTSWGASTLLPD